MVEKHGKKSIEVASVKILDEKEAEYETTEDFECLEEKQTLRTETINELTEQFEEIIYE